MVILSSEMAKLRCKLFKWISFITALHPLRMEIDEESGNLNDLKFSFFYPETWWYVFVLAVQLGIFVQFTTTSWHKLNGTLTKTGHDSTM